MACSLDVIAPTGFADLFHQGRIKLLGAFEYRPYSGRCRRASLPPHMGKPRSSRPGCDYSDITKPAPERRQIRMKPLRRAHRGLRSSHGSAHVAHRSYNGSAATICRKCLYDVGHVACHEGCQNAPCFENGGSLACQFCGAPTGFLCMLTLGHALHMKSSSTLLTHISYIPNERLF